MDVTPTTPNDLSLDDEPFEVALSRLTATMARTLSAIQLSPTLGARKSQLSSGQTTPKERKVNLKFPSPVYAEDQEDVGDEERQFGKITFARVRYSGEANEELNLRIERLSMLLEDLTTASLCKLCTLVRSHAATHSHRLRHLFLGVFPAET